MDVRPHERTWAEAIALTTASVLAVGFPLLVALVWWEASTWNLFAESDPGGPTSAHWVLLLVVVLALALGLAWRWTPRRSGTTTTLRVLWTALLSCCLVVLVVVLPLVLLVALL